MGTVRKVRYEPYFTAYKSKLPDLNQQEIRRF